ncbi:MAG TPA: SGNH/GDSL hydrolase family protein [Clostridiales bacterium]|nr:SGNH/GDSL hydrolase family protein [Clostridiales bacterium]
MGKNYYPVNNETVIFQGRTFEQEGIRCFSWTDSGFTFNFEGTDVWAEIWTNQPHSEMSRPYLGVLLDGNTKPEEMYVFPIDREGWNSYSLAQSLPEGRHSVQLVKLSEAHHSIVKVKNLTVNGKLIESSLANCACSIRAIEFIGDSITAGFGINCKTEDGPFYTKEQDGWRSYAALTARRLNARFYVIAHSGWGVYKSPYGERMPDIYEYTYDKGEYWDFLSNPVDLVVVNLGTNDSAWISMDSEDNQEENIRLFTDSYVDFIKKIRFYNPDAIILCVIGMMSVTTVPYIEQAVEIARSQGISRVFFGQLPHAISYGAGHPSAESHLMAADALEKMIREITGW